MVEAVEAAGVVAAIGFMYRFGDAVRRWREIDTGPAGLYVGGYYCNALHAHWWRKRVLSGGQILEQAIHQIDLIRHLVGEPDLPPFARRGSVGEREPQRLRPFTQWNAGRPVFQNRVGDIGELGKERVGSAGDGFAADLAQSTRQYGVVPAGETAGRPLRHDRPFLVPNAGYRDVRGSEVGDAPVVPAEDCGGHVLDVIVGDAPMKEIGIAGMEYGPEEAVWHESGLSRVEIWRRMATIIREEVGDAMWLGCGCPLWASVGFVDAVRIGRDTGVSWHGEYSAESLVRDLQTRNHASGILWQADPDCVLLRDRFHHLSDKEVRSLLLFAGLSGGLLMTSDKLDEISEARAELFASLLRDRIERCDFPELGSSSPIILQRSERSDGIVRVNLFNPKDKVAQFCSRMLLTTELAIEPHSCTLIPAFREVN
jgi:hypothetical protein